MKKSKNKGSAPHLGAKRRLLKKTLALCDGGNSRYRRGHNFVTDRPTDRERKSGHHPSELFQSLFSAKHGPTIDRKLVFCGSFVPSFT